jgi:hypothetical protein
VARLVGWQDVALIDHALRSIRLFVADRQPLVLGGNGDLVAVAAEIHRRAVGADRPFVACDYRRKEWAGDVRSTWNVKLGKVALEKARWGSLCVWSRREPEDFPLVIEARRDPSTRVHLVVCRQPMPTGVHPYNVDAIVINDMKDRPPGDIYRMIREALADEQVGNDDLTYDDRMWIAEHSAESAVSIGRAVHRLVAISRNRGNMSAAARDLGMAKVSLARWRARRSKKEVR